MPRRSLPAFIFVGLVPLFVAETACAAPPAGRVNSLRVEACLANWNADVYPDGIRVFVWPLDARGELVPVNGRIEFTLVVERNPSERGHRLRRPPEFEELQRKSFAVVQADFAGGPAVYEIPFNQLRPDATPELALQALVRGRLSIPGRGIFEASDAHVLLRDVSHFRDQLERYRGRREW